MALLKATQEPEVIPMKHFLAISFSLAALLGACTTSNPLYERLAQDVGVASSDGAESLSDGSVSLPDTAPSCIPDCGVRQCGGNGCGGSCGECPPGAACNEDGLCEELCEPNCTGRYCGPDGCGGSCGSCAPGSTCNEAFGRCIPDCTPSCWGKECGAD